MLVPFRVSMQPRFYFVARPAARLRIECAPGDDNHLEPMVELRKRLWNSGTFYSVPQDRFQSRDEWESNRPSLV